MILTCEKCYGTTQINYEISVEVSKIKFCPLCGSDSCRVRQDMDEEGWFFIAESLGLPCAAVKALYKLWDTEESKNFCDWIRSKIKNAKVN